MARMTEEEANALDEEITGAGVAYYPEPLTEMPLQAIL